MIVCGGWADDFARRSVFQQFGEVGIS